MFPRALSPDTDNGDAEETFYKDSEIRRSELTPVIADAICMNVWPSTADLPATDLVNGPADVLIAGNMSAVSLPRHGQRPSPVPGAWPWTRPLPGAVNVVCYDGHVSLTKLDNLWGLYWTKNWIPPIRRTGLP